MGPENIVIHARLVEPVGENVARDIVQENPLKLNGSLNQTEIRLDTDDVIDSRIYLSYQGIQHDRIESHE